MIDEKVIEEYVLNRRAAYETFSGFSVGSVVAFLIFIETGLFVGLICTLAISISLCVSSLAYKLLIMQSKMNFVYLTLLIVSLPLVWELLSIKIDGTFIGMYWLLSHFIWVCIVDSNFKKITRKILAEKE